MKFKMEADALLNHGKASESNNQDLGVLVKNLIAAAEPLANDFNGPAKAAFNSFKENADSVAANLQTAHGALVGSVAGQAKSFNTFQDTAADDISSAEGGHSYEGLNWGRK